jgi:hypothetical protein
MISLNDRVIAVPQLRTKPQTAFPQRAMHLDRSRTPSASYETTKGPPWRLQGDAGSLEPIGGGDGRLEGTTGLDPAHMAAGGASVSLGYEGGVRWRAGSSEDEEPHFQPREAEPEASKGGLGRATRQAGGATGRAAVTLALTPICLSKWMV